MERNGEKSLLGAVNGELTENLNNWREHPYFKTYGDRINALIDLIRSAGYGIALKVDKKKWDDQNLGEVLGLRHRSEGQSEIVEIDPPKVQVNRGTDIRLFTYITNPTNPLDEYELPSTAYLYVRLNASKDVSFLFLPSDIRSIQLNEGKAVFHTLKEVKDHYLPDRSLEELEGKSH